MDDEAAGVDAAAVGCIASHCVGRERAGRPCTATRRDSGAALGKEGERNNEKGMRATDDRAAFAARLEK